MRLGKYGIRNHPLQPIFDEQVRALSPTLGRSAVDRYGFTVRRFLTFLHNAFPRVRRISQLRREHLVGFSRLLCEERPPLNNTTRARHLIELRRLFRDMAANGCPIQPDLIRREDIPPRIHLLPRALSPEDDRLLMEELERTDDLHAHALLLIRATGMRISECIHLGLDCLRQIGPGQWALHVPVGKMYTERLVPADANVRRLVEWILAWRASCSPAHLLRSEGFLLPRWGRRTPLYCAMCNTLNDAANRAGCSMHVSPHQLRHTFATEMIRLGVSLPALMQLLGHKHITMTMRYVQVTLQDVQREFHTARQNAAERHATPQLSLPRTPPAADLPGVRQALAAARHLLEMYRRKLKDDNVRRKLRHLDKRISTVAAELDRLKPPEE
jgi:site-specific recombinase XerD